MTARNKSLYVLPNMFTVASIFCGFLAMVIALKQGDIGRASLLICLSMVLDAMDGRVARMTGTQSEFGVQLDSLADVVAFGAAPAVVVYEWALSGMGFAGVFIAFAYIACGAMRLARFNIQASEESGPSADFTGLPIPAAAAVLASVMLVGTASGQVTAAEHLAWPMFALVGLMGALMVSTVRFPTFKKVRFDGRARVTLVTVLGGGVAVGALWSPYMAISMVLMGYIAFGLLRGALSMGARRLRARSVSAIHLDD